MEATDLTSGCPRFFVVTTEEATDLVTTALGLPPQSTRRDVALELGSRRVDPAFDDFAVVVDQFVLAGEGPTPFRKDLAAEDRVLLDPLAIDAAGDFPTPRVEKPTSTTAGWSGRSASPASRSRCQHKLAL